MTPRTKLVLIFVMFALPFVGSTIAWWLWTPPGTNNYGTLMQPVVTLPENPLEVLVPGAAQEREIKVALRGKWMLLTTLDGDCDAACAQRLLVLRQSRLILDREQNRVLRVVLYAGAKPPAIAADPKFDGTVWINSAVGPWRKLLAGLPGGNVDTHVWAVDPLGNVFMRYPQDADMKRVAGDLRRVLKASRIG